MKSRLKKMTTLGLTALAISAASYVYAGGAIKEFVYYSDATYSTVVGERVINQCYGSTYTTGQVTQFVKLVGHEPCGR